MKVEAILKSKGSKVVTTRPDATIGAIILKMRIEGIGAMVVSEDGRKVTGLISERDIVLGVGEHGGDVLGMHVSELMNRAVATCRPEESIKQVMARMTQRRVRHLPVVDQGVLSGIISIGDVVKNRLDEMEMEMNVLRDAYIVSH